MGIFDNPIDALKVLTRGIPGRAHFVALKPPEQNDPDHPEAPTGEQCDGDERAREVGAADGLA